MNQLDISVGESPPFATAKCAPSEVYEGAPFTENSLDCPEPKSTETDLPSAGSAGHVCVRGLHLVNV